MTAPSPEQVAAALAPWCSRTLGLPDVTIDDVKRHAEGWSWQTYTMTVRWPGGSRGLAVRREPEDGLLAPYDIEGQYRLHRAVLDHAPEVPMPGLVALELDRSWLGMPFYVMERVEGIVPVQWTGDDPAVFPSEEFRRNVGRHFVDVLAAIHAVDWRAAGLDALARGASTSDEAAVRTLDSLEAEYERSVLLEIPVLRDAFTWLRTNVRTSGRLALCHGDYRIGNFMMRDGRLVAVFDWELADVSDPVADVAWAGLRLFRGRSPKFSQLLERDEFLARYAERSGLVVDEPVLRYWTILDHVKATVPHLRAARVFEEGRSDDLRLAAMGHQALYVVRSLAQELEAVA